jgi:hypothetical protein
VDKLGNVRESLGVCRARDGHCPVICILRRKMGRPILALDCQPLAMRRLDSIEAPKVSPANKIASLDAAITILFHIEHRRRGASEFHCSAYVRV